MWLLVKHIFITRYYIFIKYHPNVIIIKYVIILYKSPCCETHALWGKLKIIASLPPTYICSPDRQCHCS